MTSPHAAIHSPCCRAELSRGSEKPEALLGSRRGSSGLSAPPGPAGAQLQLCRRAPGLEQVRKSLERGGIEKSSTNPPHGAGSAPSPQPGSCTQRCREGGRSHRSARGRAVLCPLRRGWWGSGSCSRRKLLPETQAGAAGTGLRFLHPQPEELKLRGHGAEFPPQGAPQLQHEPSSRLGRGTEDKAPLHGAGGSCLAAAEPSAGTHNAPQGAPHGPSPPRRKEHLNTEQLWGTPARATNPPELTSHRGFLVSRRLWGAPQAGRAPQQQSRAGALSTSASHPGNQVWVLRGLRTKDIY